MPIRILLVLVALIVGCAKSSNNNAGLPPIKNDKPGSGVIVVMGDSLANGYGASATGISPRKCLENAFGVEVINIAKDGLNSDGLVPDPATREALKRKPKLIFISLGGNDAFADYAHKGSFPASKTLRNMEFIFGGLHSVNAMVLYLGLNPPFPGSERLAQTTAMAQGKGVLTVDGMNGLWQDKSKMSDQFHPNDAGYQILCDRILAALKGHFPN